MSCNANVPMLPKWQTLLSVIENVNQTIKKLKIKTICLLAFVICFQSGLVRAQEATKVMGTVRDAVTGDSLPFVNVYFVGTQVGATTGFDGQYSLESRKASDTLVASFVGYHKGMIPVQRNHFQVIDFQLQPENYKLSEVVIHPGENPAEVLLRKIIDHKPENDPDRVEAYRCEVYTKMQLDVNNLSEKFKNRRVMEPFKFIFQHMDTSVVNGKAYLPVMLSEAFSEMYFRKTPRAKKEIIKASQISGVDNASMSQFAGNLVQDVKIYDNFITLFQKNFPSPISSTGLLYYKYYLIDSTFIDSKWCYNLMFKPRRKQEYAFTGNFWVHDTTFAIKKLDMRMVADANVNFINDLTISQEFEKTASGQWMLTREQTVADFNVVEDAKVTMGFFGTRTVLFSGYDFAPELDGKIFSIPNNIIVVDDANRKTEDFWNKSRPEALSRREESVYKLADTLLQMPIFNTYLDIIEMITTGYYVKGNFEWGPYASIFSYNANEGGRFRVGGRTSNDFSKWWMLNGYAAYGTLDRTLKYQMGFTYMIDKIPDRVLKASHTYDMEQLGVGDDAFRKDFILNSLFRRNPQNKLSLVSEYKGSYKHEWFTGFSNTFTLCNRTIFTLQDSGIMLHDPATDIRTNENSLTTSELKFDVHYGYREKVIAGEFERTTITSPYPVFDLQYSFGAKNLFGGEYEFHKLQVRATQWFNIFSAGWLKYRLEAGKTWGKLPFPLLKIYPGNETFYHDDYAFNLMNYYEFISDEYAIFQITHHFEGFFLNRIPLIRKLKWREVAQIRGAVGHTTADNILYNELPVGSYFIDKPYWEAGLGIENIFRFVRVDAIWRLSYNEHPNTSRFGIMVSMDFNF